jgi:hypothetical protein
MEYINNYIEENKDRFLEDLFGLIRDSFHQLVKRE